MLPGNEIFLTALSSARFFWFSQRNWSSSSSRPLWTIPPISLLRSQPSFVLLG